VKRAKLRTVWTLALTILAMSAAQGNEYPTRPIKLMQPATAGGFSDALSRLVAHGLSANLGQSVFVENRPGAMNMLAYKMVSRAEPDGHTILWGAIDMTMAPSLRKDAVDFSSSKDLTPVAMVASSSNLPRQCAELPIASRRVGGPRPGALLAIPFRTGA
jgi:tripartite-type tricarboxylate transporter receptor subunit TctC